MKLKQSVLSGLLTALLLLSFLSLTAFQKKLSPENLTGGNGTLYFGTHGGQILIFDEATEKITGEIKLSKGRPYWMGLSSDRKRFHVLNINLEDVEIVDIATKQVVDTFRLSQPEKKVRIWFGFQSDPKNRYMVLLTKNVTKLNDRFEIGSPTLVQYDLTEHKVLRTLPWPKEEEKEFASVLTSPDGKLLYIFSDDVLIYDTTEFKQVDKWELSKPLESGFGRMNLGFSFDDVNEDPGFFTGIFTVQDPIQNRRAVGVARINLLQKSVDFYTLGPAAKVVFALAPGRNSAYGLLDEIGHYEFWTFDLEHRKLENKTEFQGRPRMALKTSSNGKLLYIYLAGNTIDVYEAATYRHLRTITLDSDMSTELFVIPAK